MRAIELHTKLCEMIQSGEITNDTEIVIELCTGGTFWRCDLTRVISFKSSSPELLTGNEMLKPEILVITGKRSLKL